jgi:hypothetical protein
VPIGEAVIMPERSSLSENLPSGQSYGFGNGFEVTGFDTRAMQRVFFLH